MPKYCIEKFESGSNEVKVYWKQNKHVHDATLITAIEKALGKEKGGKWKVRANSYQSNQSSTPIGGWEYTK